MTLMGKVVIINTLMSSLYVYRMQVLPGLIKRIKQEIEYFLWKGKKRKIKLEILKKHKNDGGLGLVDVKIKHESLLVNWINDCVEHEEINNLAAYFLGPFMIDNVIWQLNLNESDSVQHFPGNDFWHSILHMWHRYASHEPTSVQMVKNQYVMYNSNLKVENNVITNQVFDVHIVIGDIWNGERYKTFNEFCETNWGVTWLFLSICCRSDSKSVEDSTPSAGSNEHYQICSCVQPFPEVI